MITRGMFFVVADSTEDSNAGIGREIQLCNYLSQRFPKNLFFSRAIFLLYDLQDPKKNDHWAKVVMDFIWNCDAVYFYEGAAEGGKMVHDFANQHNIPILEDEMDIELFLATATNYCAE